MTNRPADSTLELVARHGQGPVEQALGVVGLADSQGREDDLRAVISGASLDDLDRRPAAPSAQGPISRSGVAGGSAVEPQRPAEPRRPVDPDPEPTVTNMVASGSLGREFALGSLADGIEAHEITRDADDYPPDVLYLRHEADGPKISVYQSGRYNIQGAGSVAEAKAAFDWLLAQLARLGVGGLDVSFEIVNTWASGSLDRPLELETVRTKLGPEASRYDPEIHSELTYYPEPIDAIFKLRTTGSVTIMVDRPGSVEPAFAWLRSKL